MLLFVWFLLFHCLLVRSNKVLLISLDGFRYDYLEKARQAGKNISAFDQIRGRGFQGEVTPIMITMTFPTHFATVTGRTAEHHGLVNNKYWDTFSNSYYALNSDENNLNPLYNDKFGNEPIWITNQRLGGKSCVFYWPASGSSYKGFYPFGTFGLYRDEPTLNYRVDRIMDWIQRPEFNFCQLYYHEPDSTGHKFGPNSTEVLEAVEKVNDGIAYLLQRVAAVPGLKEQLNIIITADHGMAYIPIENRIDLYKKIPDIETYKHNPSASVVGLWPKPSKFA